MLILYTTHLDSCSPIKTFDEKTQSLKPVPLYRILKESPELSETLVKWQEDWQACDQLANERSCIRSAGISRD